MAEERLTHNVYVVELEPEVRKIARFAKANPDARTDKPCLYVGMTGLTPEERFARHKAGIWASRFVRDYGVRLKPKYYERYNPMTYEEAQRLEPELAAHLRKRGFAVWQN